jgi:hypothetical protein
MKKYLLKVTAAAFLFNFMACSPKDGYDIKFNLPKGAKYEHAMNTEMKIDQLAGGQNPEMRNDIGFTYLFEVMNDSAGWKTLAATITKMTMDMEAMGRTMHFDTDRPFEDTTGPTAILGQILGAMKGSQFSFTINEKGDVGEVMGLKEMQEKIIAGIPNGREMISGMQESFDEEAIRQNMQQAFSAYPGKRVRIGESWNRSIIQKNQGMDIKSDNTYTLESVNGNDASVKVTSKLSSAGTQDGAEVNLTGSSEGKVHYDLPTGISTDGDIDMNMDVKVKAEGGEVPMNMKIKMIIKGKKL